MWAEVYIDGKPRGRTPLTLRGLTAGRYRVTLKRASFRSVSRTVAVKSGKTSRLRLDLRQP